MSKPKDTIFHNAEEAPHCKACLMHPERESTIQVQDDSHDSYFTGMFYGLCEQCRIESGVNPMYQRVIDLELRKRLNELKQTMLQ